MRKGALSSPMIFLPANPSPWMHASFCNRFPETDRPISKSESSENTLIQLEPERFAYMQRAVMQMMGQIPNPRKAFNLPEIACRRATCALFCYENENFHQDGYDEFHCLTVSCLSLLGSDFRSDILYTIKCIKDGGRNRSDIQGIATENTKMSADMSAA